MEEKVLAVIRAARKRLKTGVDHGVGINAVTTTEIDKLLEAGEAELRVHVESGEHEISSEFFLREST